MHIYNHTNCLSSSQLCGVFINIFISRLWHRMSKTIVSNLFHLVNSWCFIVELTSTCRQCYWHTYIQLLIDTFILNTLFPSDGIQSVWPYSDVWNAIHLFVWPCSNYLDESKYHCIVSQLCPIFIRGKYILTLTWMM